MIHAHINPTKNRRYSASAVPLVEKMNAAREISSCCVGIEALLETDKGIEGYAKQVKNRSVTGYKSTGLLLLGLIGGILVSCVHD